MAIIIVVETFEFLVWISVEYFFWSVRFYEASCKATWFLWRDFLPVPVRTQRKGLAKCEEFGHSASLLYSIDYSGIISYDVNFSIHRHAQQRPSMHGTVDVVKVIGVTVVVIMDGCGIEREWNVQTWYGSVSRGYREEVVVGDKYKNKEVAPMEF